MAEHSFASFSKQPLYVAPQDVLYGSGLGADDPNYNTLAATGDDTIDLSQYAIAEYGLLRPYKDVGLAQDVMSEADAEHESVYDFPLGPTYSSLDPQAQVFTPMSQIEEGYTLCNEADPGLEPLHPVQSPPTPRIEVSEPVDTPPVAQYGRSNGPERKKRAQSGQSSPRDRSRSISRPRAQSKSKKNTTIPRALAAELEMALQATPATPVSQNRFSARGRQSVLMSLNATFPPPGYRCDHDGCPEFARVWDTKSELNHHQRKHIPVEDRRYACKQCGKKFNFPKDVERHMVVHSGARVMCGICGKPYSRHDNLKRHIKMIHGDVQSERSTSQMSANSPSGSSVRSFAQSAAKYTGRTTPLTLSPMAAKTTPSRIGHHRHDSVNETAMYECSSPPDSHSFGHAMFKSYSNGI